MLEMKVFSELTHTHLISSSKPFDRQQSLVLLRRNAFFASRRFAERQEAPQRMPQGGQGFVM